MNAATPPAMSTGSPPALRLQDLHLLYTACRLCDGLPPRHEILFDNINRLLKNVIKVEEYCLLLENPETGLFEVWSGDDRVMAAAGDHAFRTGDGIAAAVVERGEAVLIIDSGGDRRLPTAYREILPGIGSFLSLPLTAGTGKVFGVLNLHRSRPCSFTEHDRMLFLEIANNLATAIQRTRLYEQARREAIRDELTGVYNRRYFVEHISHELFRVQRCLSPLALALLDLDHFKKINDSHGHQTGDRILAELGRLLRCGLRRSDLIARYGGEEFIIMLPDTTMSAARRLLTKLLRETTRNLGTTGASPLPPVTFTAGLAIFPEDGQTFDKLLATADQRLYLGKHLGRNRVITTTPPSQQSCPP